MARIVALMVVAVLAAAPVAAIGAAPPPDPTQSPFQQAPQQNQVGEQPAVQAPAPQQTEVDDGSIGAGQGLLIGVGIVVLIGGIWFVISRDARRVTAGHVPADGGAGEGRGGSATRASRRTRRLSAAERRRRKRGRAAK